jgi:hypothetical protein
MRSLKESIRSEKSALWEVLFQEGCFRSHFRGCRFWIMRREDNIRITDNSTVTNDSLWTETSQNAVLGSFRSTICELIGSLNTNVSALSEARFHEEAELGRGALRAFDKAV